MDNSAVKIKTPHGELIAPVFMPDATYGNIKSLSFDDVAKTGIEAVVTTTLHLEQTLDSTYIAKYGGLHKFTGWNKPIISDSGGFQVFSLIHAKKNLANKISEAGCSFINYANGSYNFLSPEISQIIQHNLGTDIRVVLDEMTPVETTAVFEQNAVDRTTRWAKRSKKKFLELNNIDSMSAMDGKRPLLCCVIQGGNNFELRKRSAEQLLEEGFDMYGFGGAPLLKKITWKEDDKSGAFFEELLSYVSELLPADKLKYALGVGTPDDVIFCIEKGWHLFDTVLPTRNARHGLLYVNKGKGDKDFKYYSAIHIKSERYKFDDTPVDDQCKCECCLTISKAYLRHLIRINEPAGFRLATIHNLRYYSDLISKYKSISKT